MLHVQYTTIAKAIRDGRLAVHLIEGKVQINVAEATHLFDKKKSDLFG
jgi:hypothetical protein